MVQGLTGSQYSDRQNNIHGAVGMSGMLLFTGGRAMHAASCMPPFMSLHVSARHLSFLRSIHGEPLPPYVLEHRQNRQHVNRSYATELHTMHRNPLKAMGTVCQTQSQGYENTTCQAHSQGYGKLLPLAAQTPG